MSMYPLIQYNNENSLSSVLAIAYLSAMQYYFKPIRELPTGRGFADFVFVPKPEYKADYPGTDSGTEMESECEYCIKSGKR